MKTTQTAIGTIMSRQRPYEHLSNEELWQRVKGNLGSILKPMERAAEIAEELRRRAHGAGRMREAAKWATELKTLNSRMEFLRAAAGTH